MSSWLTSSRLTNRCIERIFECSLPSSSVFINWPFLSSSASPSSLGRLGRRTLQQCGDHWTALVSLNAALTATDNNFLFWYSGILVTRPAWCRANCAAETGAGLDRGREQEAPQLQQCFSRHQLSAALPVNTDQLCQHTTSLPQYGSIRIASVHIDCPAGRRSGIVRRH